MDGNKLEVSVDKKTAPDGEDVSAYKALLSDANEVADTENQVGFKKGSKHSLAKEADGADEKMLPDGDSKASIINSSSSVEKIDLKLASEKQNGDTKLNIGDLKQEFVGLSKEELMKFANDPFWVRIRWFLFITFWVLWAAMLFGAVAIIYAAPKCNPPPPKTWWEEGPLSEVDIDISSSQLKELKTQGVKGIIAKFLEDAYVAIDDSHNFAQFLQRTKETGTNVIVELEPGTSQKWFSQSEDKDPLYADYYVWRDQPNNWISQTNEPSWKKSKRGYYYAPTGKPFLNFRNPNVTHEFSVVIKHFLDRGAAGVRLKDGALLLVDPKFEDENIYYRPSNAVLNEYDFYKHSKTQHVTGLANVLNVWRTIVKGKNNGAFMITNQLRNIDSYRLNGSLVVDLPAVNDVLSARELNATNLRNAMDYIYETQGLRWPLWSHNSSELQPDVLDMFTYALPGCPLVSQTVNKELLKLRDSPTIMRGNFKYYSLVNDTVFAFTRTAIGSPGLLVIANMHSGKVLLDLQKDIEDMSNEVTITYLSSNYNETDFSLHLKKEATKFPISAKAGVVLNYMTKKKES